MIRVLIVAAVLVAAINNAHAWDYNQSTSSSKATATGGNAEGYYRGGNNYGLALPSTALTSSGDCIGSVTIPLIGGGKTYRFADCAIKSRIGLYRERKALDPANAAQYDAAELKALCKMDDVAGELSLCGSEKQKVAKAGRQ